MTESRSRFIRRRCIPIEHQPQHQQPQCRKAHGQRQALKQQTQLHGQQRRGGGQAPGQVQIRNRAHDYAQADARRATGAASIQYALCSSCAYGCTAAATPPTARRLPAAPRADRAGSRAQGGNIRHGQGLAKPQGQERQPQGGYRLDDNVLHPLDNLVPGGGGRAAFLAPPRGRFRRP